ncbi:hypothetical protein DRQ50_11140 [bacterium]|nr:MAG: hypothetical protein DRQ50_11140 [bacterium]
MTEQGSERRGARRVEARLSLRIDVPEGEDSSRTANLETINISTSGAYFESDRFLAPMTKLALQLELPVLAADGSSGTEYELVACEGLIVRTTPEEEQADPAKYEVAVFFTHLEAGAASVLERHVATFMQHGD